LIKYKIFRYLLSGQR